MIDADNPHKGQPVFHAGAELENAEAAVIMLHGRGADAADILALSDDFERPDLAYLAPQAADRQPVEPGKSFSASVGKLYCYSRITEIKESTEIVHVWYYGDSERARITLGVNPPSWRTYSSKAIQAHEVGSWRVEILDASGNLLETLKFETTY